MISYFLVVTSAASDPKIKPFLSLIYAAFPIALAVLHIYVSRFDWMDKILAPYRWISLGAGVSLSYVFLEILPELSLAQNEIDTTGGALITYLEKEVYLVALIGLGFFYGLELLAQRSRRKRREIDGEDVTSSRVFWVHISAFAISNALIGRLLSHTEEKGLLGAIFLLIALALHFYINDISLREHHKRSYDRFGRWLLAVAILLGWISGEVLRLNEAAVSTLWAFVAGGIILNVIKEEVPKGGKSCFWSFSIGAGIYAALLLVAL